MSTFSSPAPRTASRVAGGVLACAIATGAVPAQLWTPAVQRWATVFGAICLQATPFVLLGAVLSAVIAVAPVRVRVPARSGFAVPVLGLAGAALPGCECGSVPAAASLITRGYGVGPAVAFMVSAPAVNPVVLVATATAYPGQPRMVAARFVASFLLAVSVGWLSASGWLGRPRIAHDHRHTSQPWQDVLAHTADEVLRSLALLAAGAAAAGAVVVWFPRGPLSEVAAHRVLGTFALAALAVLLSMCSQADAFIARAFTGFSRTAQLAFLVVGPAVDLKLAAMQTGTFGARFTARFCGTAFLAAVAIAAVVSALMW